jgi:thioredoxin family protein
MSEDGTSDDGKTGHDVEIRPRSASPTAFMHATCISSLGYGTVTEQRLHRLIRQPKPIADRELEIEFLDPGVAVFAFTFG